jgi:hypothetical protein
MKRIVFNSFLIGSLLLVANSCEQGSQRKSSQLPTETQKEVKKNEIFGINSEEVYLKVEPSESSDKLINKKASEMLKETRYTVIGYEEKVVILEEQGEWSKIKVVKPEHLSATYIGWIQSKFIEGKESKPIEKLDPKTFEIIKTSHNATVENYHVLLLTKDLSKESVREFIIKFRNENCKRKCNVYVYDTNTIIPLIDLYPLVKNDYLKMADHFVASSSFDAPNSIMWYPFQDFQYKEYGGKNWKKEPIK